MQVNSVSNSSFGQKQVDPRKALERLANADDRELKYWARQQASIAVNDKKHRKIDSLLLGLLPAAGGLAMAALHPAKAAAAIGKAGKTISPLMQNLGTFYKTSAKWLAAFPLIAVVAAGRNKLIDSSETVNNFDKKHSFLSYAAFIGTSMGVLALGNKALKKVTPVLVNKFTKVLPNTTEKIIDKLVKFDTRLNASKVVTKSANALKSVPSAIKLGLRGLASFAPIMLVGAQTVHSINHSNAKREETIKNYMQIKQSQAVAKTVLSAMDKMDAEKAAVEAAEEA